MIFVMSFKMVPIFQPKFRMELVYLNLVKNGMSWTKRKLN